MSEPPSPIYASLLGVYLFVGDIVITSENIIGRISKTSTNRKKVILQQFLLAKDTLPKVPPLQLTEYPNISSIGIDELIVTNIKQSVLRSTISAIAFVFHANDVEDGLSNFIGLENQYFVRYSADDLTLDDIELEPIPKGEFHSFGYQSSLPTQYYSFICRIQQCFKEGLCPRRWSERKRGFTKSFFLSNMDVWSIFKYHINLPIHQLKGTTKKLQFDKTLNCNQLIYLIIQ